MKVKCIETYRLDNNANNPMVEGNTYNVELTSEAFTVRGVFLTGPTFYTKYVNFYGSDKEWHTIPMDRIEKCFIPEDD